MLKWGKSLFIVQSPSENIKKKYQNSKKNPRSGKSETVWRLIIQIVGVNSSYFQLTDCFSSNYKSEQTFDVKFGTWAWLLLYLYPKPKLQFESTSTVTEMMEVNFHNQISSWKSNSGTLNVSLLASSSVGSLGTTGENSV